MAKPPRDTDEGEETQKRERLGEKLKRLKQELIDADKAISSHRAGTPERNAAKKLFADLKTGVAQTERRINEYGDGWDVKVD